MEPNNQEQWESYNKELSAIWKSENLPPIPGKLDITPTEELPDLSEWRN